MAVRTWSSFGVHLWLQIASRGRITGRYLACTLRTVTGPTVLTVNSQSTLRPNNALGKFSWPLSAVSHPSSCLRNLLVLVLLSLQRNFNRYLEHYGKSTSFVWVARLIVVTG